MRKLLSILGIATMAIVMCTSCVSTKKIVYFQGADEEYKEAKQIAQQYAMKLKPADQVLVKVTCSEPKLLQIFAQDVTVGTFGSNSYNVTGGSVSNAYGYTVHNNGEITLPAIGGVRVEGCTVEQAAKHIEQKIKDKGLISDPEVTVQLLNARVTVVGAVGSPRVVSLTSERNSIVDILAQCGDVGDSGLRYKIQLYREENGNLTCYPLDLTQKDIFSSPAYYVQQNDMIYVEPNKSTQVRSSAFYTGLSAWGSIISAVSTAVSLGVVIWNATK